MLEPRVGSRTDAAGRGPLLDSFSREQRAIEA